MPSILHKILCHGAEVVAEVILFIRQLSEEAAEARNKHIRMYRLNYARKIFRIRIPNKGFPRRKEDIIQYSDSDFLKKNNRPNPFKNDVPGEKWLKLFLKRHPEVAVRTPESVTAASSENDIRAWFHGIQTYLEDNAMFDILSDPSRTGVVLALKGDRNVYEIDRGQAKSSITVMFTFYANGDLTPPMIILSYKRLPGDIATKVPEEWDGHKTHLTLQVSELCTNLKIILIALYPNCTRILQPADVAAFFPLKCAWKQSVQHNRLQKIRPIINDLNNRFAAVPLEQRLSLDEQMCATKIGHYMKQYLPNKPHKWGFKLFLICSVYGFAHKFEIYTGGDKHHRINDEPDLGPTGNTVVRLTRIVPRRANHIIYFDNYYTSVPLVTYLAKEGIYCLGTIQSNRIPNNNKLPDKKTLMKRTVPRGHHEEQVANVDGIDISAVVWKDNKPVTLLSTYTGAMPVTTISRYDKATKQRVSINCPNVIKYYNTHMGGIDLLDSFVGRYHITRKSRKWTNRLFFHLLDVTIINSWLLYKKTLKQTRSDTRPLNLCKYRLELANSLCNLGVQGNSTKRGCPSSSSLEAELQLKKKRGPAQTMPPKDVRQDKTDHWQKWGDRDRCKYPNCKGYTFTYCEKCRVSLCYNRDNNCFYKFHTE
uniref:SFRICE_028309 n=1 Tax=Spodoptera frugiperda TaxID=7108 RepID=A0A2H1VR69_SPOFR